MIIIIKIICLFLFLSSYLRLSSAKCACGEDGGSNINIVDAVNNADNVEKIFSKLGSSSKQMCVGYTVSNFGPITVPKFKKKDINKASTTNTCRSPNSDGSIDCLIEDPYFTTNDECYPAQYFCAHQVKCPSNHRATIQCSSLDLPKSGSKCLDALRITSGRLYNKEVCGSTSTNCFPDIREAGGSMIRVTFTSGLCCQNCGYRLWVRCVPQPATGQQKREIDDTNHQIEERAIGRTTVSVTGKTTVIVNVGEVVTFSNYYVRIKSGFKTRWIRRTTWLYVKDNIAFGVGKYFKAKGTTTRKFPGYGKLTIYSGLNRIYYEQMGVPPSEEPNATEKKFISDAQSIIIGYRRIKSNIGSSKISNTLTYSTLSSLSFKKSRAKRPSCQAFAETVKSIPKNGSKCGNPGPPGYSSELLSQAKYYAANSKKPIVKSIAKLVVKYFVPKTPQPTGSPGAGPPGLVGPPGPPGFN